jgi:hypothetical protein
MKIKASLTQKRVPPCLGTKKTPDFQTPLLHRRQAVPTGDELSGAVSGRASLEGGGERECNGPLVAGWA